MGTTAVESPRTTAALSTVFEEVAPAAAGASTPDADTASLLLVPAETAWDGVDATVDERDLSLTVADLFTLVALDRFRGVEVLLLGPPPLVEANSAAAAELLDGDFAAPLLALDAAGRWRMLVGEAVFGLLTDAAGPLALALSLDGDDDPSDPDASAWATPVPPMSADPIPRVSAPAPSHAYGSM